MKPTDFDAPASNFVAPPGWRGANTTVTSSQVWAVSALLRALTDALDARFNPVTVKGEISGFSQAASGHCYFNLKDGRLDAQMRCAMFKRAASALNFRPKDGDAVQLRGKLGVYDARGELQLIVETMERAGQGNLFEQFVQLKAKLQAQGLFDAERKRTIPSLPRGIGLVTSLGAAALQDVSSALARRAPHIPVTLAPAAVQGAGAAQQIIEALQSLYRRAQHPPKGAAAIDVILLVRGGGSMDDLWSFNDEALAHAIAQSPVPLVCGVGHETDFTIADFVADLRAPTPTAAAELCAAPREDLLDALLAQQTLLQQALQNHIDRQSQKLDWAGHRLARPSLLMAGNHARLGLLGQRLQSALGQRTQAAQHQLALIGSQWSGRFAKALDAQQQRVQHSALRLQGLDPSLVLERGYAWLQTPEGQALTSVSRIAPGQAVQAQLADGRVDLTANAV